MNVLPRLLTKIALGSFGLSLLLATTAGSAAELNWRAAGPTTSQRMAPPQNDKIRGTRLHSPPQRLVANEAVTSEEESKKAAAEEKSEQDQKRAPAKSRRPTTSNKTRQIAHTESTKTKSTTRRVKKAAATAPAKKRATRVAKSAGQEPAPRVAQTKKSKGVRQASAYTPSSKLLAPWQRGAAAYGMPGIRTAARTSRTLISDDEVVPQGEIVVEPETMHGMGDIYGDSGSFGDGSCCGSCGDAGCCGSCSGGSCGDCGNCGDTSCCFPFILPRLDNITIFGGPEAFKGPGDLGENGDFGFGVGINAGGAIFPCHKIGYQIGYRYVGSNFNGAQFGTTFLDDTRSQSFFTAGIFRRARHCCPWQWGIAYDYLHDRYHYDADLSQVRIELSRKACWGNELGVLVMQKVDEQDQTDTLISTNMLLTLEAQNQYLFFIRRQFDNCGEGRLWGGVSGDDGGIVGGDLRMPITSSLAVNAGFNYLFAEGETPFAQEQDSYGVSINLVWHPRCSARSAAKNPFRPLFDVANNNTFFTRVE
ncbi:MAG: hypothetical protein DWQ31_03695 [Planctomycetota bacterium]|nr:MAG: hypothetical protein DWQ31_03695 [Planctomycetota bacterium]REJ93985.1 MAG: hypothetical protein DWQ35_09485 [Planctomycetota bacterium]REK30965.1 MAG: hypothetical protein DWQ42_01310 [Planctomycetota bacterium]REK38217.1 MAG: hypothetical protein DWQ46_21045 [Planctomycetota bacterium]